MEWVRWAGHRGIFRVVGSYRDGSVTLFGPAGPRARFRSARPGELAAAAAPAVRR